MARRALTMIAAMILGLLMFDEAEGADLWEPALRIPGGRGIDFFLGHWAPTGTVDVNMFETMTIEREHLVFGKNILPSPYKVLKEGEREVLIFVAQTYPPGFHFGVLDDVLYEFALLSPVRHAAEPPIFYVILSSCYSKPFRKPARYTAKDFERSPEELLALLREDPICGPKADGPKRGEEGMILRPTSQILFGPPYRTRPEGIPLQPDEPAAKAGRN